MRKAGQVSRAVLSVVSGCVAFAWAWTHLGPDSSLVGPWTSDAAVPVLMSNAERLTPFHLYYLAQDRFGALPYIFAALVRQLTGFVWTPERLAHLQQAAIFASIPAVALLLRPRWLWGMAWTAVLVLLPWRFHLFDLCQPYGWQLTAFFFAWWALRRLRSKVTGGNFALAAALGFVACWISAFSAPLLLCAGIAEALGVERGAPWKHRALPLGTALLGAGLEVAVRALYQLYSKRNFGNSFRTRMHLTPSGALDALGEIHQRLGELGAVVPFAFVALLAAGVVAFTVAVRRFVRREPGGLDDNTITLLGLAAIALATVLVPALGSHFRENGLQQKYFTVTAFTSVLGVLIAIERTTAHLLPRHAGRVLLSGWAVAAVAAPAVFFVAPRADANPDYARQRHVARELARRAPGAFIVSGYWETFSLAALALPDVLRPYLRRSV